MDTLYTLTGALARVFMLLAALFFLIFLDRLIRKRQKKAPFALLGVLSLGLLILTMNIFGDMRDYNGMLTQGINNYDDLAGLQARFENTNTIFDASENVAFLSSLQTEKDGQALADIVTAYPAGKTMTLSQDKVCRALFYVLTEREDFSDPLPLFASFLPSYETFLEGATDNQSRGLRPESLRYRDDDQTLLKSCGTAPRGKAIVYIHQEKPGEEEDIYALYLGAMTSLPTELLPTSPEEVAYVVYIEESVTKTGTYLPLNGTGVAGYRRDVSIALYKMPGMELLEDFGTVMGGELGDNISMPAGSDQSVIFGKDPDPEQVERLLAQAIAAIPR